MNLSLNLDPAVVAKAKRIARRRGTSVSAMASMYFTSLSEEGLPPITQRVLDMGSASKPVPDDWNYRRDLTEALEEKFGIR